uniref:Mannosyl-oligosaccharide glucosidase n=1 Tax=Haemonchus contortus TaxID=6289 RepID=A0A7I4YKR3_HAECO
MAVKQDRKPSKQKSPLTGRQKPNRKKEGFSWNTLVVISALLAVISYFTYTELINPSRHLRKMMPPISGLNIDRKKWGSYRAHTYFGLRTKDPRSPLFGIMWYKQPAVLQRPHIRHWCDQGDDLKSYGWYAADGRTFGRENVTDRSCKLSFDWIGNRETWTAGVHIYPRTRYTVIVYMVAQDSRTKFRPGNHLRDPIKGRTELFGDIELKIDVKNESEILHSTLVWDDDIHLDHLNELILMNTLALKSDSGLVYQLGQQKPFHEGRFVAIQFNIQTETNLEITFSTRNNRAKHGLQFTNELSKKERQFDQRFEEIFQLEGKNYSDVDLLMAKTALANMLGSIGYWHGYNKVHVGGDIIVPYGPHELFSAVPSRSYFPRGFLWDEGFHNLLIHKFDPDLSIEILVSWLNTMSEDGWIPREMILGVEAEAKVPSEFIVQRTNVANPPSIFYVIDQMLSDKKLLEKYRNVLAGVYPRLEAWYRWLRRSQAGKKKGTFRWRGRNSTIVTELNPKTLASGLDDYPRASHPSEEEYHLDLRCWMALSSRVMVRLAHLFEEEKYKNKYDDEASSLADYNELVRLHWSDDRKAFFDYGLHSNKVQLSRKLIQGSPEQYSYERSVAREPKLGFVEDVFGYNSLFPLMLRLLPAESDTLSHILDSLRDPELIWTEYGLRSIAQSSPYYDARNTEHDPPYWRGNIWVNVNYMVLSALNYYGSISGPSRATARTAFVELKKNLVTNMAKEFNRTGYIWEHYDDKTGQGRGSHPFNGWSSLVLLIMSDNIDAS